MENINSQTLALDNGLNTSSSNVFVGSHFKAAAIALFVMHLPWAAIAIMALQKLNKLDIAGYTAVAYFLIVAAVLLHVVIGSFLTPILQIKPDSLEVPGLFKKSVAFSEIRDVEIVDRRFFPGIRVYQRDGNTIFFQVSRGDLKAVANLASS